MRIALLSKNHTLNLLLDNQHSKKAKPHYLSLGNLISKQYLKLKSSVVDSNNYLNEIFPSFDNLYKELSSGFWLVDNFSNYFYFYSVTFKNKEIKDAHIHNLNKIFEKSFLDSKLLQYYMSILIVIF